MNYTYDNAWRLTNEAISGDPVTANNGNLSYLLDAVANRTSLTSTLAALSNQSFIYDANDRILSDISDANGNTLTSGGKSYTYDFLDRLVTANGGTTLTYDGDGSRVARNASGVATRYLIDDQTPVGFTEVAEEVVAGLVTRRYAYGMNRISQTLGPNTSYYLYDGGGSVRALADGGGIVTDTFTFDAFGDLIARSGNTPNDMLYRGQQIDSELGLYYLRTRWYNSLTGRFLTADKYELDGKLLCCQAARVEAIITGGPAALASHHLFSYANHDPVNWLDRSGESSIAERVLVAIEVYLVIQNVQAVYSFGGCMSAVLARLARVAANLEEGATTPIVDLMRLCVANFLHDVLWDYPFPSPIAPPDPNL